VNFEGSNDNSNWVILGVMNTFLNYSYPSNTYTNGYFKYYRFRVNPNGNAACNGKSFSGVYTGYQSPLSVNQVFQGTEITFKDMTSFASVGGTQIQPTLIGGLQCTTPNAATFLQIVDSAGTPTLGTAAPVIQVSIPQNTTYTYTGPPLMFFNNPWFGASTTLGGATPVASNVICTVQANQNGPFYPFFVPSL
jgi:hypothetical protein